MKIALAGTAGTGKSTLATEISNRFNTPLIPEYAREVAEEMGLNSPRDLPPNKALEFQSMILDRKVQAHEEYEHFIEDRSTADSLAYFLRWNSRSASEDQSRDYVERCKHELRRYDKVVLLPFGGIPYERDGFRTNNLYYAYEIHCLILGILTDFHINYMTLTCSGLEDRVAALSKYFELGISS